MTMMELSVPRLTTTRLGYLVTWDEGTSVECAEIYKHSNKHIEADVTIRDTAELDTHLIGPVRTYITKTWRDIVQELQGPDGISQRNDWRQRLTQVSKLVKEAYASGTPTVALDLIDTPEIPVQIIENILWQGTPTIIFGAGGIGKSILSLLLTTAIHNGIAVTDHPVMQKNVLWLDWETTESLAHWRSSQILKGFGIESGAWPDPSRPDCKAADLRGHAVFYKEMVGTLADNVEALGETVDRLNIEVLLIDSAIPACGGEAESPKVAQQLFTALQDIKRDISSIIVGHVTKEAASRRGKTESPFGSTVWRDRARMTFELRSSQKKNSNVTEMALHQRKSNMGPILQYPLGYRLTWPSVDSGMITVEGFDVQTNKELVGDFTHTQQAWIYITENGPTSTDELSEMLDVSKTILSSTLSRADEFISVPGENGSKLWQRSATAW